MVASLSWVFVIAEQVTIGVPGVPSAGNLSHGNPCITPLLRLVVMHVIVVSWLGGIARFNSSVDDD